MAHQLSFYADLSQSVEIAPFKWLSNDSSVYSGSVFHFYHFISQGQSVFLQM